MQLPHRRSISWDQNFWGLQHLPNFDKTTSSGMLHCYNKSKILYSALVEVSKEILLVDKICSKKYNNAVTLSKYGGRQSVQFSSYQNVKPLYQSRHIHLYYQVRTIWPKILQKLLQVLIKQNSAYLYLYSFLLLGT